MSNKFNVPEGAKDQIETALESAFNEALESFNNETNLSGALPEILRKHLDEIHQKCETASAAFTNIITGLAIKIAFPKLDVRYHQTQIQADSAVEKTWFNHRGISEKIVYPWLSSKNFSGAKSGWQTRTLERPKPYTRGYSENISHVKTSFLEIYEATNELEIELIKLSLKHLIYHQIILRESRIIDLATPNIDEISTILEHLKSHINYSYKGKGGSRLPVLAIFATLQLVSEEISRYNSLELKPLEEHSAADSQTGSAGDIEFETNDGDIIEALEIKHGILISSELVSDAERKISPFQLDRYYILTTSENCKPNKEMTEQLRLIKRRIGCQVIVNGVFPTIQYYLRLLSEPQEIYKKYTELLETDNSVTHEHREVWNELILGV